MSTELTERRPRREAGFVELHLSPVQMEILRSDWSRRSFSIWQRGPIRVISALEDAELPGGTRGVGPQWHISITSDHKRPKPLHVRRALRAFGMVGAEEDNHHPGNARHFWKTVDPALHGVCDCKTSEQTIVESDGYTWTNPRDTCVEPCRGCEWAATGIGNRTCPIHGPNHLTGAPQRSALADRGIK